jgi:hypothetical protein
LQDWLSQEDTLVQGARSLAVSLGSQVVVRLVILVSKCAVYPFAPDTDTAFI